MTMNWTPDRPTKPGEYWLSICANKRRPGADVERITMSIVERRQIANTARPGWTSVDSGPPKQSLKAVSIVDHLFTNYFDLRASAFDDALWAPRETPADPFAKPEPKQYVILDTRQIVGNCAMFWRPDGAGYTCDLSDAGLYDKTEGRRETDIYVPIEVARSMAVIHVRVEPLKRAGYWSKPQTKDARPQRCAGCPRFVKRGGWLCSKCATKGW